MIELIQKGSEDAAQVMQASTYKTDLTVQTVGESAKVLDEILAAIRQMHEMSIHIATAAEQQHAVTESVSNNITSAREMTSSIAEDADKSLESNKQSETLAVDLSRLTSQFTV